MPMTADQTQAQTATLIDLGTIFVSLELSKSAWLVTALSPGSEKMSRHTITGGDIAGLFSCFAALRQKSQRRKNMLYPLVVNQEVGLDGFWLGRVLSKEAWIESHIVEAASIAMPRRHRRAKTDRIDGETLIRALIAWKRGEPQACSMVKLLTPDEEDIRRLGRERKTLIAERVFHVNRIKGLLFAQGVRDYEPVNRDRRQRLEELGTGDGRVLSKHLKAEICTELDLSRIAAHTNQGRGSRARCFGCTRGAGNAGKSDCSFGDQRNWSRVRNDTLHGRFVQTLRQSAASCLLRGPSALPVAKRQRQSRAKCLEGGKSAVASDNGRTCLAMVAAPTKIGINVMVQGAHCTVMPAALKRL